MDATVTVGPLPKVCLAATKVAAVVLGGLNVIVPLALFVAEIGSVMRAVPVLPMVVLAVLATGTPAPNPSKVNYGVYSWRIFLPAWGRCRFLGVTGWGKISQSSSGRMQSSIRPMKASMGGR